MYWFIILFPLMIYPWGFDPYYTTTKANYLYIFVLLAWIYLLFTRKYRNLIPRKDDSKVEIGLLILFLFLVEISVVISNYTYTSIHGLVDRKEGLISFFSYCSIFLFSYRFMDEKRLDKVLSGMAIVSIFVSIYGILQHYSLDFLPRNSSLRNYTGTYTFFDNPNFFGSYLVLALLITVPLFLTAKNKKYETLYFSAITLAFISLIFSNTRSGYLGVFFGVVFVSVFVVLKQRDLWRKWTRLFATLALILILINITEKGHYFNRISSVVTESYSVATNQGTGHEGSSRLFIWQNSLPLIKDYFWFGSGPDTFPFIFKSTSDERQRYFGTSSINVDKAHNEYLQLAITLGTPALLTYLLFLIFILLKAFKAAKVTYGRERILMYGLIGTIGGYLVQAFFNISTVPVAPIFWAVLGITLFKSSSIIKRQLEENSLDEDRDFHEKDQIA
ncbi:O-antigen ligase family protein [Mesobacillus maritimus]|uniref:O-antigen ligase family protein n=1 Tax=Mesobacillus maritimus TaxID=1643336 RepID=UPI00384C1549